MRIIPVKIKYKMASVPMLVDDEDYEMLCKRKWSFDTVGRPRTGVTHKGFLPNRVQVHVRVHKAILWSPPGYEIDHIDGDPLNNQKANLRVCTHKENSRNQKKHSNAFSKIKGACWHKQHQKWQARIHPDGKSISLGLFETAEEAGKVYDEAAKKLFGEYARLNTYDN